MSAINHFPWHQGAGALIGKVAGQKTVKTYCERRVAFDSADAEKPVDCPKCCAKMREHADGLDSVMSHGTSKSHGYENLRRLRDDLRERAVA